MLLAQTPPVDTTSPTTWIIVAIVVIVIVAILGVVASRRRSQTLRTRFGPEYDRTVEETGSRQRAEAELAARQQRAKKLDLRELTPGARDRYADAWREVQARFVDRPGDAVRDADRLITDVMRDRGYPVDDLNRRYEDLSVDHAAVLDNYRTANDIAQRNARGETSTEDLRQAMVAFRALFADLLGTDPVNPGGTVEGRIVEPRRSDARPGGVER